MNLVNLEEARPFIVEEVDLDISQGKIHSSSRLTQQGGSVFPRLLRAAAVNGSDRTLTLQLQSRSFWKSHETRHLPSGKITQAKVPVTAPETLAEGEFNRFYIRGVCRLAIERGIPFVVAYRAKQVAVPRPDSQAKIGRHYDPAKLLSDLREHIGVEPALGLPKGPNSGLSVKLPDA